MYRDEEKRKQEVIAVHKLGKEIGYGNLMDIAQTLWAMSISNEKFLCGHIVSTEPRLKKVYAEQVNENIQGRAREIMFYLEPEEFPEAYGTWALTEREHLMKIHQSNPFTQYKKNLSREFGENSSEKKHQSNLDKVITRATGLYAQSKSFDENSSKFKCDFEKAD